ncbi:hypothetical protein [Ravibacter arvi]|uniref:hypothetical protein n=1 Tax=Ravibacter arvi TaxID=2051041 RepID=UPI0031E9797B
MFNMLWFNKNQKSLKAFALSRAGLRGTVLKVKKFTPKPSQIKKIRGKTELAEIPAAPGAGLEHLLKYICKKTIFSLAKALSSYYFCGKIKTKITPQSPYYH